MKVIVKRNNNDAIPKPMTGFHYVDQGNYLTLPLIPLKSDLFMYSDSATSCIIVIVVATSQEETTATVAHLDSPACISSFFAILAARHSDSLQIFAQGANPPDNQTSRDNAKQLEEEIQKLGNQVTEQQLFLLEGDPQADNRGDFGFHITPSGVAIASNQPYILQLTDRDPTCGGQMVYCIMRRQEHPPTEIRNAGLPFTHAELVNLSSIAMQYCKDKSDPESAFTNIVNMESKVILDSWSSTPQYEAPWFCDQLKQGACFALSMSPVVHLSQYYLAQEEEGQPFARLGKMLLGT